MKAPFSNLQEKLCQPNNLPGIISSVQPKNIFCGQLVSRQHNGCVSSTYLIKASSQNPTSVPLSPSATCDCHVKLQQWSQLLEILQKHKQTAKYRSRANWAPKDFDTKRSTTLRFRCSRLHCLSMSLLFNENGPTTTGTFPKQKLLFINKKKNWQIRVSLVRFEVSSE